VGSVIWQIEFLRINFIGEQIKCSQPKENVTETLTSMFNKRKVGFSEECVNMQDNYKANSIPTPFLDFSD